MGTDLPSEQRPSAADKAPAAAEQDVVRSARTSRTWTAAILSALVRVLLLIFIPQKRTASESIVPRLRRTHAARGSDAVRRGRGGTASRDPRRRPHGSVAPGGGPPLNLEAGSGWR
jgi:hypothetical protein